MGDDRLGRLLGEYVHEIYVSKDQSDLYIANARKGNDVIRISTYSDCCSETWFADIIGVDNVINERIIGVKILDMPDIDDGRTRQEYDCFYGFRLTSAKGSCDFIYRNSSNGYYGGSINDVVKEKVNLNDLLQVTEDKSF